jgi:hypothetical protein
VEEVEDALASFPKGSAGGLSGLMAAHLHGENTPARSQLLQALARVCSDFAWGNLPMETSTYLAGARLIPLGKKDGGVRPIAIGELIRRVAGKILVRRYQHDASQNLCPVQLGVGTKGGCEAIIHKSRDWFARAAPNQGLVQLDFSNAFNTISRQVLLDAIARHCPFFLPFAVACYGSPSTLSAPGISIQSAEGSHQGCPCSPLFFGVATFEAAKLSLGEGIDWAHWYLDDGALAGSFSSLDATVNAVESAARSIGLRLNRAKCCVLFNDEPPSDCLLRGIPRHDRSKATRILGTPLGDVEQCKGWVDCQVINPLQRALDRLENLADPQAASLILRQCLSACKGNWILRTADPGTAAWAANMISPLIRKAWATILGSPVQDAQWELANLPVRLGGAGISDPRDIWEAANVSSWLSALSTPGVAILAPPAAMRAAVCNLATKSPGLGRPLLEAWDRGNLGVIKLHPLYAKWCSQECWMEEFWEKRAAKFDAEATDRLSNLRRLQEAPNAGLWMLSTPEKDQGSNFSPIEWQALLCFRTGVPLRSTSGHCARCGAALDVHGDHALACTASGLYRRHNRVRDAIFELSRTAGWAPESEVMLPGCMSRPADVLLRAAETSPVALDVTVSHPLRLSSSIAVRGNVTSSAEAAERQKLQLYGASCQAAGWLFRPMGFETTGGIGPHGARFVRKLTRTLSMRSGVPPGDVASSIARKLNLAVAKGCAEMLVGAHHLQSPQSC